MKRPFFFFFRTANDGGEMRLSAAICTANIAAVSDGEWGLIAPYGRFPSPGGDYEQDFSREQAEKVVRTWNSITGKAARVFKNLWHRRSGFTLPVWDGHPETDAARWPVEKLLAEVTDLRTGNIGLEGLVKWTANGTARRSAGPLFPSPLWWHCAPSGEPPTVYPELLESIGLVPTPNISAVPAWTANAHLPGAPEAESIDNMKHRDQLIALLGLKSDADDAAIQSSLDAHGAKVNLTANSLTTANAAKAELETKLSTANAALLTANGQLTAAQADVTKLTTERDTLTTTNAALVTEKKTLVTGLLDLAEKKGAITPAERADYETKLSTANTAADVLKDLPGRKAINTQSVEINGTRVDLSTANARSATLGAAVNKRMKDEGCDYNAAYAAVKADPQFKGLFEAMADPTRKTN